MTNQAHDIRTVQESEDDGPSSPMPVAEPWRPRWHQLMPRAESPGRYSEGTVLGEGGMGVVRLVQDLHLDRSVAMKSIKGERGFSSTKRERFLREVWVQGQLDHPAIVPIYDVFRDARGSLFFTMKPVSGETLDEIFRNLRAGTREFVSRYSTRRLLTAFVQVCMAVHHAHTRGISHRDIKPANIILGENGEVYLLDWGIAKVENGGFPSFDEDGAVDFVGTHWNQTSEGMLLGTPGYMAPEQASGETDRQGPASDVYSLGAILYEIVVGSPLHQPKPYESLEESTIRLRSAAIEGARSKKVPPDLEELWLAALVTSPEERHLSARSLGQGIERFLDKAWDADRRREVASEHAEQAAAAAQRALADRSPSQATARKRAMEELGKAMALDPANRQALDVLATLVSQPPTEVPEEVSRELESLEEDSVRKALDVASKVDFVGAMLMVPLMLIANSWSTGYSAIFILTLLVLSSFLAYLRKKTLQEVGAPMNVGIIFMCCAILLWVACSFGSPIGTWPMGVLMVICGLMAILLPMRSIFLLPLVVAGGICVLGGHLILESLGYIPKTIEILSPTEMVVYARQFAFQPGVTILATLAGACLLVAINTTAIFVFRRQSAQAKRQLQMMSWQIRQLVPAVEHETIRPSIRPQGLREGNRFSEP